MLASRLVLRFLGGLIVTLCTGSEARAQASLQVPLQFDFLNPGARSLALGGAFTGMADDATAAFANPAGLLFMSRPEISFEGPVRRIETPFLQRGRLLGAVTGRDEDNISGPVYGKTVDIIGGVSFASFVYPRQRWAVAGYRHELVKVRSSFETRGVFQGAERDLPLRAVRDIDIVNYGVSAAVRVHDRFIVGGGVSVADFSLDSSFSRYGTAGEFGPPLYFSDEVFRVLQVSEDWGIGANAGIIWNVHSRLQVGAVYRRGPRFTFTADEGPVSGPRQRKSGEFRVPDVYGIGIAARVRQGLRVAADYTRIEYSTLRRDYITLQTSFRPENFHLDDGNEFHAGVEYVFTQLASTPAIRFGAWYDPDHAIRYERSPANDGFDVRFSAVLPGGKDLVHYTVGGGVTIGPRVELNAAADFSSRRQTGSVSAVIRF